MVMGDFMKIDRINLKEFGKYSGGYNIMTFDDGVNLIIGKNESGKSTLFNGILTMLYGFKPADKRKNIFSNWNTESIDIEGEITFGNKKYEVSRKLLSSPKGHLSYDERKIDIGNSPLFFLDGIGRETFKSIYFLNAYDMVKIHDNNWNEIEDRLIMNSGISGLMLARDVLSSLNDEIRELYKSRGNSQIKDKKNEILELKRKRKELIFELEIFNEKSSELEKYNRNIVNCEKEILDINENLKKVVELQPIAKTIVSLKDIKRKINSFEKNFGNDEEEISKNLKECKIYIEEIENSGNREDELRIRKEKFFTKYQEIFCKSFDEGSIDKIKKINFTNLEVTLKRITEIKDELLEINEKKHNIGLRNVILRLLFGITVLALGIGIIVFKDSIKYEVPSEIQVFLLSIGSFVILDNFIFMARNNKKSLENAIEVKKKEISELMMISKEEISEEINQQMILASPMGFFAEVEELRDISDRVPVKGNAVFDIFSKLGEGNHKKGIEIFKEYLKDINRMNFIFEEFEKIDPACELRNSNEIIEEESFINILNSDVDEIKTNLELKKNNISQLKIEKAKIEKDLEILKEKLGSIDMDEEIKLKEFELEKLMEKYDELNTIKKIIEFFDQKYRDENQPAVIRDTGFYMDIITDSKYSRIYSEENRINDIMIKSQDKIISPESGYSRGTMDQIYMAFRLAIAKSLDNKEEKFPMFLDEAFINWDEQRFEQGLKIINSISTERQIFIFTCHKWVAERVKKEINCKTIEII